MGRNQFSPKMGEKEEELHKEMVYRKKHRAQIEDKEKVYNELAAALGDSRSDYSYHTGPKYLLRPAANAILKLVPPPTSEVDEASWEAFLNGEEGGN